MNLRPNASRSGWSLVSLLLGVLLSAALTAAQAAPERPVQREAGCTHTSAEPLSQQLGLELKGLFNVLALEESTGYARLRIVARTGPAQILRQLEAALGDAWERQPAPAGRGGVALSSATNPLTAAIYRAHYRNADASRSLRVVVQPIGRSNLFRLELQLSSAGEVP